MSLRLFISIFLLVILNSAYSFDVPCLKQVRKVDASEFRPNEHYLHRHEDGYFFETPVLIERVLSVEQSEIFCNDLIISAGKQKIDMQHKFFDEIGNSQTEIIQCTLENALEYMMESQHDNSFFCFCEGLMDDYPHLNLRNVKERLFQECSDLSLDKDTFKRDVFDFFPDCVRPSDCVVIAGEGATSTLHRDPFTWTGTSICLEGTKVWRFIAPPGAVSSKFNGDSHDSGVSAVDQILQSYRLQSAAWGNIYLSAGWQSDFSLYESRDANIPSAEELSYMEHENYDIKQSFLEEIASSFERLTPSAEISKSHFDGEPLHYFWVVQKPGDLLVIPAYWWHQTYALEPSIAIASQRGGLERDAERIFRHVIENTIKDETKMPKYLKYKNVKSISPEKIVDDLFQLLSVTR